MASEFTLIDRYFTRPARHTALGVGDDAALIQPTPGRQLAISSDMLVAGTHFYADTDPQALGWKTLAVNVSDLAAMGAQPRWATLALSLPAETAANEAWLAAFSAGFFACADQFGIDLIGGDTTRGPLNFCVTIFGEVAPNLALRRDRAQAGDDLWVSGSPGLAALGLAHLQGRCALESAAARCCLEALHQPQPKVDLGLTLAGLAHGALDISDGLLADLGHLLQASGCGATLYWSQMPPAALMQGAPPDLARDCLLAGGDDYELLFTAPVSARETLTALPNVSRIGIIRAAPAGDLLLLDARGEPMPIGRRGFDHFA